MKSEENKGAPNTNPNTVPYYGSGIIIAFAKLQRQIAQTDDPAHKDYVRRFAISLVDNDPPLEDEYGYREESSNGMFYTCPNCGKPGHYEDNCKSPTCDPDE